MLASQPELAHKWALASREDQRLYLRAVQALVNGNEAAAEPLLQRLRAEAQDAQRRGTSTQLLAQQYFAAGQWERYRALGEITSPQDPMRVMVEALGDVSGAHFNPAVTICLFLSAGLPLFKAVLYIISQYVGAFIGGAFLYGITPKLNGVSTYNSGLAIPDHLTVDQAFAWEW